LWFAAFASFPLPLYVGWVVVAALAGIVICGEAAKQMGVHDHPGIVWDEFVGQWIALVPLVPLMTWDLHHVLAVLLGFALFRLFDIWKPW
ncbi:phosphatidylglycerophosphatase A, partial [Acinetobacter baumannii]